MTMPPRSPGSPMSQMSFPKPRGATLGMLLVFGFIWLTCALAFNWGGADPHVVEPLLGNRQAILHGQVWRLFTAILFHMWSGDAAIGHITTTLLVIYFFAPALEDRWGWKKLLWFSASVGVFGYVCQIIV